MSGDGKGFSASDKDRRLAEALRRNLRLRKAQAKSRRSGSADDRAGLAAAVGGGPAGTADRGAEPPVEPSVPEGRLLPSLEANGEGRAEGVSAAGGAEPAGVDGADDKAPSSDDEASRR